MTVGLTQLQAKLLDYLTEHPDASLDEMAAGIGRRAKSHAFYLLNALEERGYIRRLRGRARAVEVLRPRRSASSSAPALRVVFGPGHFEDLARLNRARWGRGDPA